MKKLLLALNLIFVVLVAHSQVPDLAWVKKAQGTTLSGTDESGRSIARDNLGNSYVTGSFQGTINFGSTALTSSSSNSDVFIAKYDASGNVLWARKAGDVGTDEGISIAVDGSGNSYITGNFQATITFGGTTLTNTYGSDDVFIAKYDASGNVLWARQAASGEYFYGAGIAVDGSGNSYVTGIFYFDATFGSTLLSSIDGSADVFIAKYDVSGNTVWAKQAGGYYNESSSGIAVDGNGNPYITGNFEETAAFDNDTLTSSNLSVDAFIAKYDSLGNTLWARQAGGTYYDNSLAIAVDANGNSYITGSFEDNATFGSISFTTANGNSDFFIAKLDTAGNVLWANQAGATGSAQGQGIALDSSGNSFVTGVFDLDATFGSTTLNNYNSGSNDAFVVKFDALGNVVWATQGGSAYNDYSYGITVDGNGNSYITGSFLDNAAFGGVNLTSSGNSDIFVAKYDGSGGVLWGHNPAGYSADDFGRAVATDAAGNSYVTGSFEGTITLGSTTLTSSGFEDIFIAKYDAAGNVLWAQKAGGNSFDVGMAISADNSGNAYVTGFFYTSATFGSTTLTSSGYDNIFIAKYDPAGNVLWATKADVTYYGQGTGIAVDNGGNAYVTGYFNGVATFGSFSLVSTTGNVHAFAAKFDASGNCIWAKKAGGTNAVYGRDIAIDGSGNSYTTGFFIGSATFGSTILSSSGNYDIFLTKYDAAGNLIWAKKTGGNKEDRGNSLAVDANGNAIVTGSFQGSITFGSTTLSSSGNSDAFVAKFDAAGNVVWATKGGGTNWETGQAIAVDGSGNSYVTGYMNGNATFGSTMLTSSGGYDVFAAKYDVAGNAIWAIKAAGPGSDEGMGIAVDNNSNSFITGYFQDNCDFGNQQLNTNGREMFLAKLLKENSPPTNVSLSATSLNENVPGNTLVGFMGTTDPDAGDTFTYSLVAGTGSGDNAAFTVAGDSLKIIITPDFETKSSYDIRLRTTDQRGLFFEKNYTVSINDLNEAPVNLSLSANTVNENVAPNTGIGSFSSTDPDTGNAFTHSLVNGTGDTDNAAFSLSGDSLRMIASPDFEAKSTYNLRIRTTDQGGLFLENTFVIMVKDVNEAPVNLQLSATSVNENVTANSTVGTFTTTDPDAGNTHTYLLVTGTGSADNAAFSLAGNSLKILSSPDFEARNNYNIRVRVTDQDSLFFDQVFNITINDINEPTVALSGTTVNENSGANAIIGNLSTVYPNPGKTYSYTLVAGSGSTDNAAFFILSNALRSKTSPNYELKNSYSVRIRTTELGGLFYEKEFTISVNNVNETPTNLVLSASVAAENTAANAAISKLITTDPDAGSSFTYSLVSGTGSTDNAAFTISGDSLRIIASPNFEAKSVYGIRIRSTDQGGLFFEKAFAVTITNLNETPFNLTLSATAVNENVAASTNIGYLTTTDPDANNAFTYSLVSGTGSTDNAAFLIYGSYLRIRSVPNFEAKNSYSVRIRTSDQGGLFFEKEFTITVNDLNEKPANIELSAMSVDENVAPFSAIGKLNTTDPDTGNTFIYSLVAGTGSTDNAAFTVTGDSLRVINSPNYELKNSYSIRIRTTDQGSFLFEKVLVIAVNNLNESPVNLTLSATLVNENVVANTMIGTLLPTDPDIGNTFAYSLVAGVDSTDNSAFSLTGNVLRINVSPNFEVKNSYRVRIRVTDQGSLYIDKDLIITVNNVNEPPANLALSASTVNENVLAYTTIGTFSTTDPDPGNTFTYTLITGTGSTDNTTFTVFGDSLKIKYSPNFEIKKSYSIRVRTTDQGRFIFDKVFTISVMDVNEPPANLALSAATILENAAAITQVGTLSASDPDPGNTIAYSLAAGMDSAAFNISGNSLRIVNPPNFEAKSSYSIRIRVTDQSGSFSEKDFTITVLNLNETPTNLALSPDTLNENVPANSIVGTFATTDPDAANTFVYSLVAGTGSTDNASFSISGNRLLIRVSPNYEVKSTYSIRIRTKDQGGLFFDKPFTITIKDANDIPGNLTLSASSVFENVATNTLIGTLNSTDPDADTAFVYTLVSGTGSTDNASFTIFADSLRILVSPDFDTKSTYSIRIRTTDEGGAFLEKTFAITVKNVNETPVNLALSATSVNENVAANSNIGFFTTTDPDAANTFTYTLVAGPGSNDNAAFTMYSSYLRIKTSPNFEVKNTYSIRIRTTDQGGLFFEKAFTITINNLNDTPSSLALSAATINENVPAYSKICTLSAVDQDSGSTFTYALVSGTGSTDNAAFSISGDSLKIINSPDFETKSNYSIRLRTTDQGGAFLEKAFIIYILNLNETPVNLTFSGTSVNENVAANSNIGYFATTDQDVKNTFTYSLVAGTGSADNAAFIIYRNYLRIKSVPNFEIQDSYNIRIRTTDPGGLYLEKEFTIAVNNVNETPINLTLSAGSVNENVPANTTVGTFATTGPDNGNTFTYSLVAGTGSTNNAAFNISGDTLRITASPNFQAQSSYSIRIRTTDQGGLFFEKAFTIAVNEVYENQLTPYNIPTGTQPEALNKNQVFRVYPNPSTRMFNLEISNTQKAELWITDPSGKTIAQENLVGVNGMIKEVLNLNVAQGIYLLRIKANGHWETKRLIVE